MTQLVTPMSAYTILVVDDEPDIIDFLKETLEVDGYRVYSALHGAGALKLIQQKTIDVILSDNRMPEMSGIELFEQVRKVSPETIRILMTGYADLSVAIESINRGWVYKFLTKPFKVEEMLVSIRRAIEFHEIVKQKKALEEEIIHQKADLVKIVEERTNELRDLTRELERKNRRTTQQKNEIRRLYNQLQRSYLGTITSLYFALEAKDQYTRGHSERVFHYSLHVGRILGLNQQELTHLKYAALLHDLGKIGIPDSILRKSEQLTEEEYQVIKGHSVVGATILDPIPFLKRAKEIIRHHHEHFNGTGYPDGQRGDNIDIQSRVITVTDAFDAMRSDRPYRKALCRDAAMAELRKHVGAQFCPQCVDAFDKVLDEIGDFYDDPDLIEKYRNELRFMEDEMRGLYDSIILSQPPKEFALDI
ncbi:MAG: response regulator [bacterium]|nr:response regulator [bacterium]